MNLSENNSQADVEKDFKLTQFSDDFSALAIFVWVVIEIVDIGQHLKLNFR